MHLYIVKNQPEICRGRGVEQFVEKKVAPEHFRPENIFIEVTENSHSPLNGNNAEKKVRQFQVVLLLWK